MIPNLPTRQIRRGRKPCNPEPHNPDPPLVLAKTPLAALVGELKQSN
jgi:hypothetical protein